LTSPIAAAGLLLDGVGALALASSFMFKRASQRLNEATSHWDWNAALDISLAKQTADAWVGGVLLAAGFAGQFASSVGGEGSSVCVTLPIAAGIAVASIVLLLVVLRPWYVRNAVAARLEARPVDDWPGILVTYGPEINVQPKRGSETPAAYGRRLLRSRRWQQLTASLDLPPTMSTPYAAD
jgi:hypothetical protein